MLPSDAPRYGTRSSTPREQERFGSCRMRLGNSLLHPAPRLVAAACTRLDPAVDPVRAQSCSDRVAEPLDLSGDPNGNRAPAIDRPLDAFDRRRCQLDALRKQLDGFASRA
jgi:hypothetical protein